MVTVYQRDKNKWWHEIRSYFIRWSRKTASQNLTEQKHCSRTAAKEQLENPTVVTCRHCFDPRLINSAEAARFPRWIMSQLMNPAADPLIGARASATLRPLSAGFPQDTESQDCRNWFAVLWITWCNNNAGQLAEQQEQQPVSLSSVCLSHHFIFC